MARLRTGGLILLALAALGLPSAVAAAGSSSEPAYLTARSADVTLNGKWEGAKRIPGTPQNGLSALQAPADPPAMVWAAGCGAGQQEAIFRRTVELLGPPSAAATEWWVAADGITPNAQLKALSFVVNGHRVFTQSSPSGGFGVNLPRAALGSFKDGANELEVDVVRPALPKGKTRCNVTGQKPVVAVSGKLHVDFATDLRVGIPEEKLAVRSGTSILIDQFVKNEGTDAALNAELEVYYGGSRGTFTVVGGSSVKDAQQGARNGTICPGEGTDRRCAIGRLDPGQSYHVLVKVA